MQKEEIKKSQLLGAVLAGGQSRRMGGKDKFLLDLEGKRVVDHIVGRLIPQVDKVILNTNRQDLDISTEVVPDIAEFGHNTGPLVGFFSVLNYAKRNGFKKIVTVSGDAPFIPHNFVEKLMVPSSASVVVAKSKGRLHPTHALWGVSLINELGEALTKGERKMMSWIKSQNAVEIEWSNDPDPFFNINTPEDLAQAKKLAGWYKLL